MNTGDGHIHGVRQPVLFSEIWEENYFLLCYIAPKQNLVSDPVSKVVATTRVLPKAA